MLLVKNNRKTFQNSHNVKSRKRSRDNGSEGFLLGDTARHKQSVPKKKKKIDSQRNNLLTLTVLTTVKG